MSTPAPVDRRKANVNWHVADSQGNAYPDMKDAVAVAILMDIRDELRQLNRVLNCPNFLGMPGHLAEVVSNTRKRKRKPKVPHV